MNLIRIKCCNGKQTIAGCREMNTDNELKKLFDYQRFEKNDSLENLIKTAENRYAMSLSDEDLSLVNAAGEVQYESWFEKYLNCTNEELTKLLRDEVLSPVDYQNLREYMRQKGINGY